MSILTEPDLQQPGLSTDLSVDPNLIDPNVEQEQIIEQNSLPVDTVLTPDEIEHQRYLDLTFEFLEHPEKALLYERAARNHEAAGDLELAEHARNMANEAWKKSGIFEPEQVRLDPGFFDGSLNILEQGMWNIHGMAASIPETLLESWGAVFDTEASGQYFAGVREHANEYVINLEERRMLDDASNWTPRGALEAALGVGRDLFPWATAAVLAPYTGGHSLNAMIMIDANKRAQDHYSEYGNATQAVFVGIFSAVATKFVFKGMEKAAPGMNKSLVQVKNSLNTHIKAFLNNPKAMTLIESQYWAGNGRAAAEVIVRFAALSGKTVAIREVEYALNAAAQNMISPKERTEYFEYSISNTLDTALHGVKEAGFVTVLGTMHPMFVSLKRTVGKMAPRSAARINHDLQMMQTHVENFAHTMTKGELFQAEGSLIALQTMLRDPKYQGNPSLQTLANVGELIISARKTGTKIPATEMAKVSQHWKELLKDPSIMDANTTTWLRRTNRAMGEVFGIKLGAFRNDPAQVLLAHQRTVENRILERAGRQQVTVEGLEPGIPTGSIKNPGKSIPIYAQRAATNPETLGQLRARQQELLTKKSSKNLTEKGVRELEHVSEIVGVSEALLTSGKGAPAAVELSYNILGVEMTAEQLATHLGKRKGVSSTEKTASVEALVKIDKEFKGLSPSQAAKLLRAKQKQSNLEQEAEAVKREATIRDTHQKIVEETKIDGEKLEIGFKINELLEHGKSAGGVSVRELRTKTLDGLETLKDSMSPRAFKDLNKLFEKPFKDRAALHQAIKEAKSIVRRDFVEASRLELVKKLNEFTPETPLSPIFNEAMLGIKGYLFEGKTDVTAIRDYYTAIEGALGYKKGSFDNQFDFTVDLLSKAQKGGIKDLTAGEVLELRDVIGRIQDQSANSIVARQAWIDKKAEDTANKAVEDMVNHVEPALLDRIAPWLVGKNNPIRHLGQLVKLPTWGTHINSFLSSHVETLFGRNTNAYRVMHDNVIEAKSARIIKANELKESLLVELKSSGLTRQQLYEMSTAFKGKRVKVEIDGVTYKLRPSELLSIMNVTADSYQLDLLKRGAPLEILGGKTYIDLPPEFFPRFREWVRSNRPDIGEMSDSVVRWFNSPKMREHFNEFTFELEGYHNTSLVFDYYPTTRGGKVELWTKDAGVDVVTLAESVGLRRAKPKEGQKRVGGTDQSVVAADTLAIIDNYLTNTTFITEMYRPYQTARKAADEVAIQAKNYPIGTQRGMMESLPEFYRKIASENTSTLRRRSGGFAAWLGNLPNEALNRISRGILIGKGSIVGYQSVSAIGWGAHLDTVFGSGGKSAMGMEMLKLKKMTVPMLKLTEAELAKYCGISGTVYERLLGSGGSSVSIAAGEPLGRGGKIDVLGVPRGDKTVGPISRLVERVGRLIHHQDAKTIIAGCRATEAMLARHYKNTGRESEIGSPEFNGTLGRIIDDTIIHTQPGWSAEMATIGQLKARDNPAWKAANMFRSFTGRMTSQQGIYTNRIIKDIRSGNVEAAWRNARQMFYVTAAGALMIPFIREEVKFLWKEGVIGLGEAVGLLRTFDEVTMASFGERHKEQVFQKGAKGVIPQAVMVMGSGAFVQAGTAVLKTIGEMTETELLQELEAQTSMGKVERHERRLFLAMMRSPDMVGRKPTWTDVKIQLDLLTSLGVFMNIPESFWSTGHIIVDEIDRRQDYENREMFLDIAAPVSPGEGVGMDPEEYKFLEEAPTP